MSDSDLSTKIQLPIIHYTSHRLSKFWQIEYETVRGPFPSDKSYSNKFNIFMSPRKSEKIFDGGETSTISE